MLGGGWRRRHKRWGWKVWSFMYEGIVWMLCKWIMEGVLLV